jgi:hypothetical protein
VPGCAGATLNMKRQRSAPRLYGSLDRFYLETDFSKGHLSQILRGQRSPIANDRSYLAHARRMLRRAHNDESQSSRAQPRVPGIVKFWRSLSLNGPPFVHPQDVQALKRRAADLLERGERTTNLRRFIASSRFDPDDRDFHFALLPSPYVGDVRRADILLLLLNPGFRPADYYAEWDVPEFRDRVTRNLYQRLDGVEFPFFLLDPRFCWHTGYRWWEGKLRKIAIILARKKYEGCYFKALRELANRVAAIELVPYHSAGFSHHSLLDRLASVKSAQRFVQDASRSKCRLIVVLRGAATWGLSTGKNVIINPPGFTRGANLGPNTQGGKAMLAKLGVY